MRAAALAVVAALAVPASGAPASPGGEAPPAVTCGIPADMPGLAAVENGRAAGFDVDLCRAVAAVLTGDPARARFVVVDSVHQFLADPRIDIAVHALTAKPEREASWGVRFGPVLLVDGQGFVVRDADGAGDLAGLAGRRVCVVGETAVAEQLAAWLAGGRRAMHVVVAGDAAAAAQDLADGRCDAWSADMSVLVATLSGPGARRFRILGERISREPLAPIVRDGDDRMLDLLRLVSGALLEAERGTRDPALDRIAGARRLGPDWRAAVQSVAPDRDTLWRRHFVGKERPIQSPGPSRPDYSVR